MKVFCTHDGSFHADDVMGYVILRMAFHNDSHVLKRSRNQDVISTADIVWDVGGGKYDHHFKSGKPFRDDGVPYSSAGLLWKDFGRNAIKSIISPSMDQFVDQIWAEVDGNIIIPIDKNDNGCLEISDTMQITLIRMVTDFNLSWDEEFGSSWNASDEMRSRFIEISNIVEKFLVNRIRKIVGKFKAQKTVIEASKRILDGGIIELPCGMPWTDVIFEHNLDVNFVIYPSGKQWRVNCVPPEPNSFGQRISLPAEFAGLTPDELRSVSPFHDLYFVHAGRFTAGTGSRETAIKLCRMAYEDVVERNRENQIHAG